MLIPIPGDLREIINGGIDNVIIMDKQNKIEAKNLSTIFVRCARLFMGRNSVIVHILY